MDKDHKDTDEHVDPHWSSATPEDQQHCEHHHLNMAKTEMTKCHLIACSRAATLELRKGTKSRGKAAMLKLKVERKTSTNPPAGHTHHHTAEKVPSCSMTSQSEKRHTDYTEDSGSDSTTEITKKAVTKSIRPAQMYAKNTKEYEFRFFLCKNSFSCKNNNISK